MKSILDRAVTSKVSAYLKAANEEFARKYPGEPAQRQPVHTIYGGAHLFKADTAPKMGKLALKNLETNAPDPKTFSGALNFKGDADLAATVYERVVKKLQTEPVEDFRIDFEDGFGSRPDAEEDATAVQAANEVAKGMKERTLPPFLGIRVKPLNRECTDRSLRTLELFLATLFEATGGKLPDHFVVTLPKVQIPEQVRALVDVFEAIESKMKLLEGSLKMEIMIETTQAVFNADGVATVRRLAEAAGNRCTGAHFGTYDYTACVGVTSEFQTMDSPVCDFARNVMKVALAQTGIFLSDGATNIMPVGGPDAVHKAWKLQFDHIQHSLKHAYYQGWDLHPGQIPVRYAAVYSFFLNGLDEASTRLKNFMDKAAQATLSGDIFDDAATGQGLINYFLRAWGCGAITKEELKSSGLTLEEIKTRSFLKILENRKMLR